MPFLAGEPLPPSVTVEQYEYNFINVSWSVPWSSDLAPVLGYIVQLVGPGGSVDSVRNVTGSGRLTYTFDGLAFDTLYRVQVAAYNSVGQGVFAEVRQTTRIPDGRFVYVEDLYKRLCVVWAHACVLIFDVLPSDFQYVALIRT